MTVGEKIQAYRKRLGMSQDELGQKLLVSRQTVSLWEKDQTVPTIDNLIRLREIFGVSVDGILGFNTDETDNEDLLKEKYVFNFSEEELDKIHRLQMKSLWVKPILFAIICVVLIIIFAFSEMAPSFLRGLFAGFLLIGETGYIKGIRAYKKSWTNSAERVSESTYEYKVFDDYIRVDIWHNNERIRDSKCYFKDIEAILPLGDWLVMQFGGLSFLLRKNDLREDSFFLSHTSQPQPKKAQVITPPKWRAASIILFVASLMSIFGALFLVNMVSTLNGLLLENVWLFYTITPIPITSIIFGFVARSKGYSCKKNIIAGFIMTALLCIYGSFVFIF